jgi:hypothetical protein
MILALHKMLAVREALDLVESAISLSNSTKVGYLMLIYGTMLRTFSYNLRCCMDLIGRRILGERIGPELACPNLRSFTDERSQLQNLADELHKSHRITRRQQSCPVAPHPRIARLRKTRDSSAEKRSASKCAWSFTPFRTMLSLRGASNGAPRRKEIHERP